MGVPRLPNNTIASLECATACIMDLWPALRTASERAERIEDPKLLAALNRAQEALAGIEHHTRNARANKFIERRR